MSQAYTHTTWTVKPGLEDEFVRRWTEWVNWSALQGLSAPAKLLRDVDDPRRFVSYGPWRSIDAARQWRAMPGFHQRISRLQEVVERFEPSTLEQVAES